MSELSVYEFGEKILETKDLDPVYILLWEAKLEQELLCRWLLSYWSFYHVGTASWIADLPELGEETYWNKFSLAASSKDYPRCHERRHYRGENARKSVAWLREQGIASLFSEFYRAGFELKATPKDIMEYVQEWVGFGPWIAFKVADMLERLDIVKLCFDSREVGLYDSPQEGAKRLWRLENPNKMFSDPGSSIGEWAIERILSHLGTRLAPPRYERRVGVQEAETILCKWKSYLGGHYEIGEDVMGCRRGLTRFSRSSPLANRLFKAGAKGGLW